MGSAAITARSAHGSSEVVAVIGNGMVGQRFIEKLVELDAARRFRVVTFCEEPRAAYDRVGLTSFFTHRDAAKLMIARREWYREHGVELHVGDRADVVDRARRVIRSQRGMVVRYDHAVLATGSYPFVPPVPGFDKAGVFVYRTIEDLQHIIEYAKKSRRCAVIGGGLLGLEAAKAALDLGLETHVIEFAPRLMQRQLDDAGARILTQKVETLGVRVHLNTSVKQVQGQGRVEQIEFNQGGCLDVQMVIISAGVRPRDDLAKASGIEVGQRGGIVVDDRLRTSDPAILAIGECALHRGMVYGLVAPGYEMAEIVATNLTGGDRQFQGTDVSTKLKLLGCDVAAFGDYEAPAERATPITFEDPFGGVYKKLLFNREGNRLLGGMLVGDARDYGTYAMLVKASLPLPCPPHELVTGKTGGAAGVGVGHLPDEAQVCSCHNVTKGAICRAIADGQLDSLAAVKAATRAGTGCGGCLPLVTDLFHAELKQAGKVVVNQICEHFPCSRTELFAVAQVRELRSFDALLAACGRGNGCEVCKPVVASILASLWNEHVLDGGRQTLQDTNDRFLANIQRGGLYSVVPRVPGGEITPEKLAVIAEVGREFGLYTKITGGQRIDLLGARVQDLPTIWERLVRAGFESGHAYGKALRTVKSCVGSTWCRYGVQDSVGCAIRLENRYKGIRAPHKIKMAVSGCVRECAEAQGKDVGLVATERGYNLYVCGNGGAQPRHADLLVADIDEATAIQYIDRFLMYYISTADRLTRTSVWLGKLEGGIDHLRDVVIHDKLGIAAELEAMLQRLIDGYACEWAAVVNDPEKRRWFQQFVNSDESAPDIAIVSERGQPRPADWPSEADLRRRYQTVEGRKDECGPDEAKSWTTWVRVGSVDDFPLDGGATIKYGQVQIAVFNFASRGEWYATQNLCPHRQAMVLSRGILGDQAGEPKVACPLHKQTFSLRSGESLQNEAYRLRTFPVRIDGADVLLKLPPMEALDRALGTAANAGPAFRSSCSAGCTGNCAGTTLPLTPVEV